VRGPSSQTPPPRRRRFLQRRGAPAQDPSPCGRTPEPTPGRRRVPHSPCAPLPRPTRSSAARSPAGPATGWRWRRPKHPRGRQRPSYRRAAPSGPPLTTGLYHCDTNRGATPPPGRRSERYHCRGVGRAQPSSHSPREPQVSEPSPHRPFTSHYSPKRTPAAASPSSGTDVAPLAAALLLGAGKLTCPVPPAVPIGARAAAGLYRNKTRFRGKGLAPAGGGHATSPPASPSREPALMGPAGRRQVAGGAAARRGARRQGRPGPGGAATAFRGVSSAELLKTGRTAAAGRQMQGETRGAAAAVRQSHGFFFGSFTGLTPFLYCIFSLFFFTCTSLFFFLKTYATSVFRMQGDLPVKLPPQ